MDFANFKMKVHELYESTNSKGAVEIPVPDDIRLLEIYIGLFAFKLIELDE